MIGGAARGGVVLSNVFVQTSVTLTADIVLIALILLSRSSPLSKKM